MEDVIKRFKTDKAFAGTLTFIVAALVLVIFVKGIVWTVLVGLIGWAGYASIPWAKDRFNSAHDELYKGKK